MIRLPLAMILLSLLIILFLVLFFFLFYRVWFCRKPQRPFPKKGAKNDKSIISPADGKVVVVQRFDVSRKKNVRAKKWNKGSVEILCDDVCEKGWFILIMMTPLNVHYQRAPFAGTILSTKHTHGKFLNAVVGAENLLTLENERNEILMQASDGKGKIKIVQIAGYLARRITSFVKKNQNVDKGEELGFIGFGSQVALILPATVQVQVKVGDKVVDGETVMGVYR